MKSFKIISLFCAFLALLNTVDVHALSHVLDGDDHNQVENCQICEEFVVSTQDHIFIIPFSCIQSFEVLHFLESQVIISTEFVFINQEKHLGQFHNRPPPFTI